MSKNEYRSIKASKVKLERNKMKKKEQKICDCDTMSNCLTYV